MDSGIPLMIVGGWFKSTWIYWWLSPGFVYGLKLLFVRSKVTSKKSITFMFAFSVILSSSSLNFSHSFLMLSFVLGFFFTTANPSSLYIPASSFGIMVLICDRMNRPISSQVSTPSHDTMVTSKRSSAFAFFHG